MLHYELHHQQSHLGVAFFTPRLKPRPCLSHALEMVCATPTDAFLRAEARRLLVEEGAEAVRRIAAHPDPTLAALALEAVLLTAGLEDLASLLHTPRLPELAAASPLIFLRNLDAPDASAHRAWSLALGGHVFQGMPRPPDLPPLPAAPHAPRRIEPLDPVARLGLPPAMARPPLRAVLQRATDALASRNVLHGPELRHGASLAPWGLTRSWRLHRRIVHGRLDYDLTGIMTSYGRGMSLEGARVSLSMEIVERVSSFASIAPDSIQGLATPTPIHTAQPEDLPAPALDLETLRLEAPAPQAPVAWMPATTSQGESIWVPVQAVFLFANLDEPKLFGALGSTGLASGSSMDEARLSGLLEVLERDAEIVSLWDPDRAFRPTSRDPEIQRLLQAYARQGIDLVLQDITTEFGIPCMRALVPLPGGGFAKATAASLCGKQAALAAITEVPFPFPKGPASARLQLDLPCRVLEDLPDLSTGSATGDRALVEAILMAHGYYPLYADLTRSDLGIPVTRALVPGLETATDLDEFSRVSPRMAEAVLRWQQRGAPVFPHHP